MVKAYIRFGKKFLDTHQHTKTSKMYKDVYEWFVRDVFYDNQQKWEQDKQSLFGERDYKSFLEEYFGITFNE